MEVSASTSRRPAQPKRARSTSPVAKGVEPVAKKAAAPRKSKKPVAAPSAEEIVGMISMAAYCRAAERGFAPGHEMEDWLAAEKQVLASI